MSYYKDHKDNIILADCEHEELVEFIDGLENGVGETFALKSKVPKVDKSLFGELKRYITYTIYPLPYVLKHKKYKYVIGWQQFYALFYVFYCKLLHRKKENIVIVLNFTYKEKHGFYGRIYKKFMNYCIKSDYLDYIHVPSKSYAKICAKAFEISEKKFIITHFGLSDTYEQWKNSSVEYMDYSFSIGRSNRDFDFLVEAWEKMPISEVLIIASDVFKPKRTLPSNVIHRSDIIDDAQFPYIANCKLMIIPIDNGEICSGDTVLLKAMSYKKPLIVTVPSTLGEMYIENGVNGILSSKEIEEFINNINSLLQNDILRNKIAINARNSYLTYFSRKSMGANIASLLLNHE